MAKQNIAVEDLLDLEDQMHEIARKLSEIRREMVLRDVQCFAANAGTLRSSVARVDEFSLKLSHEFAVFQSQERIRKKL